jgi:hypothetical protein
MDFPGRVSGGPLLPPETAAVGGLRRAPARFWTNGAVCRELVGDYLVTDQGVWTDASR